VLEQRADVYILSLPARTVLSRHQFAAPEDNRVSFSPWLMGWEGDKLFLRITGCPAEPGASCYGPLVRASVFSMTPDGRAGPDAASQTPALLSTIADGSSYLSVGVEPYGVSIGTQLGQPREPLMRYSGQVLEPVWR
jgi:hypothetical protein